MYVCMYVCMYVLASCVKYHFDPTPSLLQLPWAEFDNQFTIMYQLGSGKRPPIPRSVLSEEGHHFLDKCFIVDVQRRASALDLCSEPFVMVRN